LDWSGDDFVTIQNRITSKRRISPASNHCMEIRKENSSNNLLEEDTKI